MTLDEISADPAREPPQLKQQNSVGHVTRLKRELADAGLSRLADPIVEDLGIESLEGLLSYTFEDLQQDLKDEASVDLKKGQIRQLKAFLSTETGADEAKHSRVRVADIGGLTAHDSASASGDYRSSIVQVQQDVHSTIAANEVVMVTVPQQGATPNTAAEPWGSEVDAEAMQVKVTFHLSTFEEAAPLTASKLHHKAEDVRDKLRELPETGRRALNSTRGMSASCRAARTCPKKLS